MGAPIVAMLLGALMSLAPAMGEAAIDLDTLARIKAATVFVSLGRHRCAGSGSGFLVHRDGERGLVVTNAHVIRGAASRDAITVVFDSGTRRANSVPGRVLALSRSRDLAVLEVKANGLPAPLEVSSGQRIHETQAVHIAGFPFGKGFATNRETPLVTLSRGTISSQRLDVNDQPRLMQIDGDLNPGNSGGPIVDEAGQVVGVAVSTVKQTNIGFAIPLDPLHEVLAGTLTDLEGERTKRGVRVRGRLLDPLKSFESARLRVRVMPEDSVLQLLGHDGRWASIAPSLPGAPFTDDSRALQRFSLPALQTIHLTLPRLDPVSPDDVEALEQARRRDPRGFERRLAVMRRIDERRNFSATVTAALSTSVGSLSRLLNDIHPRERRMLNSLLPARVSAR